MVNEINSRWWCFINLRQNNEITGGCVNMPRFMLQKKQFLTSFYESIQHPVCRKNGNSEAQHVIKNYLTMKICKENSRTLLRSITILQPE